MHGQSIKLPHNQLASRLVRLGASVAYTIVSGLLPEGGGGGVAGKVDPASPGGPWSGGDGEVSAWTGG